MAIRREGQNTDTDKEDQKLLTPVAIESVVDIHLMLAGSARRIAATSAASIGS